MTSGNNPTKKIALAIVTYNSAAKLPDCLASLAGQNYPSELIDLIVVDNNSSDNSLEIVSRSDISARIIKNSENVGFASANNQAYELAKELGERDRVIGELTIANRILKKTATGGP